MVIEDLQKDLILPKIPASSSDDVFKILGQRFIDGGYAKASYIDALESREKEFPTGIDMGGYGVAIPHTETQHVIKNGVGIATLERPVTFMQMGAEDEALDVQLVFMLASASKSHIDLLQSLLAILQDKPVVDSIIAAQDSEEILNIINQKKGE